MPVDPRHLSAVGDLIDSAFAAIADAELAADALSREFIAQGAHPATTAHSRRLVDHLRRSLGLAGAAGGALDTLRRIYGPQLASVPVSPPTEGERTGGAYLPRQRPAQAPPTLAECWRTAARYLL